MASLRFPDVQTRPTEFLAFTSLTLDEFPPLLPPFEAAFQAHMAAWCLDGKPRTVRQFAVYKNCPLPTPEERLFFLLTSLKTSALQVVQGRLFGRDQSKANQWIQVLLPALLIGCCRKFSFEAIYGMTSLHDPGCIMRESDDGDQRARREAAQQCRVTPYQEMVVGSMWRYAIRHYRV